MATPAQHSSAQHSLGPASDAAEAEEDLPTLDVDVDALEGLMNELDLKLVILELEKQLGWSQEQLALFTAEKEALAQQLLQQPAAMMAHPRQQHGAGPAAKQSKKPVLAAGAGADTGK